MLRQITALIKKDFQIEISYKFAFILNIFSVAASLIIYYFIDLMFGRTVTTHLEVFGVNYFPYVLLSMAFFSYIGVGVGSFAAKIRDEQLQGTLESLLLSATKVEVIILSMGLWNLIFATFNVAVYLIFGHFVFNVDFSQINLLSTLVILILTIISFSSLGIISASFILVLKRGNPVDWVINTLEGILGGVYFPVTVMPKFLQVIAHCLPITYAIRGLELAVYKGATLYDLRQDIIILALFSLVLAPVSLWVFKKGLRIARTNGSLAQY
ncbi:MAG: ABC transporter permease [Candidatus Omnitrophica bacterium]|nr:ABC transporter permease [Candidatus Omnitrophota bacterium]